VGDVFDYESDEPNINLLKAQLRHLLEDRGITEITLPQ
jgi:hypothetical protein